MKRIPTNGFLAGGVIAVVVGLGAAGAIAANGALSPSEESTAIIDDAASQLGVQPNELSSALRQAMKNRIDAAVDAGRLTEQQAQELKDRIDSGDFPLLGVLGHGGLGFDGHGPGHFGGSDVFGAAASYLGLSGSELRQELENKTLAEVAEGKGKSVTGLVGAMVASAEKGIDQAVEDGKLTKQQATELKGGLEERMTNLVNGEFARGPGLHGRGLGDMDGDHMGRHGYFRGPPA